MRHLNLFILLAFSCFLIVGCTTDEDPENPSNTDLLTAHDWVVTGLTYENSVVTPPFIDVFANYPDCQKDGAWTFEDVLGVGGYQISNPDKCLEDEPNNYFGEWEFLNDETEIEIDLFGQKLDAEILTLDDNTFEITFLTNLDGTFYTAIQTFSKK